MARFIGRAAELGVLTRAFESARSEFIPIYGRRRVGKSELILRFMADKPGVYYLGQQSSAALQVREFLEEAARALHMPLLAELRAGGWRQALLTVVEQWTTAHPGAKLVLALDEFQWMAASSPDLLSTLQQCWDRSWRGAGNVLLLLCGSYLGFMERDVLGKASPLFGRRTAQIHLQPFDYLDAARFHPRWSPADRARAYFLVGGLPQYLLCLDDARSIEINIRQHLLDEFAPLFHEPTFLLREELRELAPYHAILFATASGPGNVHAIASATGLSDRNLHYYLQQLVNLGYVRRRYPLEGRRRNPKQVRFGIDNPLLRFWFRFVFPQHERHPRRGRNTRIPRAHRAGARRLVRRLLRTPLPGGASTHLRERGGHRRIRDRRILESADADRCRRFARRQLDGSRRVQVGCGALAAGIGGGTGSQGQAVSQHSWRNARPALLRPPQARCERENERLVLARKPLRAERPGSP